MIPDTEYAQLYQKSGSNFRDVSAQVFEGQHPCEEGKGECCLAEVFPIVPQDVTHLVLDVMDGKIDKRILEDAQRQVLTLSRQTKPTDELDGDDPIYKIHTAVTLQKLEERGMLVTEGEHWKKLVKGRIMRDLQDKNSAFCPFFDKGRRNCKIHEGHPLICEAGGGEFVFTNPGQEQWPREDFTPEEITTFLCEGCHNKLDPNSRCIPRELIVQSMPGAIYRSASRLLVPVIGDENKLRDACILDLPGIALDLLNSGQSRDEIVDIGLMIDEIDKANKTQNPEYDETFGIIVYENENLRPVTDQDISRYSNPFIQEKIALQGKMREQVGRMG